MSPWTPEELAEWDRLSTENMIFYYRDELVKIAGGERANKFLSKSLIIKLRELNVLTEYKGKRSGRVVTLSRKGRQIIGLPEIET